MILRCTQCEDLDDDVARVEAQIRSTLGEPSTWPSPVMLPSVAQCVLNSIYSTGNRSETVVKILNTYRERRRAAGADPDEDGPDELLAEVRSCGGPEGFADAIGNHTRAWQRKTAPYKAQVVHDAAHLLRTASIHDREALMAALADHDGHTRLKQNWLALPGQRPGLTWRYFLMNSGMPGIKADRMITRWTSRAVQRPLAPPEAERILTVAAENLDLNTRSLDHAVWNDERNR